MDDLSELIAAWPVPQAAVGVTRPEGTLGVAGDTGWQVRIASISKVLVGVAAWVALEEETISLDEPAGPPGSTVRHLLAHAAGLAFRDHQVISPPGRRRIYSNAGIEQFADHLASKSGMSFEEYLRLGVLEPLGMGDTRLVTSPADGIHSTVNDLLLLGRELLAPTLVSPDTLAAATRAHFPELKGVLPGVGSFDPNPWGLGVEIRNGKAPHWTGSRNSPRTFGHFGGSGTFLWVDPEAQLACVALASREFDDWALQAWPPFSDAVLERYR